MTQYQDIEDGLRRLGACLPKCESLADSVMTEIERRCVVPVRHRPFRRIAGYFVGAAAMLMIAVGGWFLLAELIAPRTLYADVLAAIRNANTFHLTLKVQTEKETKSVSEAWYKRDVGYRTRFIDNVWISDGKFAYTHSAGQPSAIRWAENIRMDDNNPFIRGMLLPNFRLPTQRATEADRAIHGQQCLAYIYQPGPKDQPLYPDPSMTGRLFLWFDGERRIHRSERQIKKDATWQTDLVCDIEYDAPVESSLFDPKTAFGPDVKIVDADRVFDERYGLKNVVFKQDFAGLRYAVHEFKACADGTILVVSSIRRDDQTEKEFPPQYRSIRPGLMIAEAADQEFVYHSQIELASAVHGAVLVQWWLLRPVPVDGPDGPIKPKPGKVMYRATFRYSDNHLYEKYQPKYKPGERIYEPFGLMVVLDEPNRKNPLQRAELAAHIYRDVAALRRFACAPLTVGRKIATSGILRGKEVVDFRDPDDITQQEYTKLLSTYLDVWAKETGQANGKHGR
jgi:hypothetical protein